MRPVEDADKNNGKGQGMRPHWHDRAFALGVGLAFAVGVSLSADAAKRPSKPPQALGEFTELFDRWDSTRWSAADGWSNGSPFANAWSADHALMSGGELELVLDDTRTLGQPYTSGELRTNGFYGYGCYEASIRPVAQSGTVTSFFTFSGPYDNGGNGLHNEIDVEFLGRYLGQSPSYVQFNFWTNDDRYASRNEYLQQLDFDAAAGFHRYGFKWTASGIEWFVDGQSVYDVTGTAAVPTPKATESLQKVMMNLWPVDGSAAAWAGTFTYPGTPLRARYQWVRHIPGEDCSLATPPGEPPPPGPGEAGTIRVDDIAMSSNSRGTQAIAMVYVVDDAGRPVEGATVLGQWSGAASGGDGSRVSGADGLATFYSSRSRTGGEVTFCVTGVALTGKTYDPSANLETCASVWL